MPVGVGIAVLGLVYLLVGWRISVIMVMLATAIVLAGLGWFFAAPHLGTTVGIVVAIVLGVVGFLLGRYVHRLGGAVNGAVVLGVICVVPGLVVGSIPVMAVCAVIGGVIGALLGWRWANHMDAVASSIAGAQFIGAGVTIIAQNYVGETIAIGIGLAVLVVALIFGISFQFRDIKHSTTRMKKATGRRTSKSLRR